MQHGHKWSAYPITSKRWSLSVLFTSLLMRPLTGGGLRYNLWIEQQAYYHRRHRVTLWLILCHNSRSHQGFTHVSCKKKLVSSGSKQEVLCETLFWWRSISKISLCALISESLLRWVCCCFHLHLSLDTVSCFNLPEEDERILMEWSAVLVFETNSFTGFLARMQASKTAI
jgi:hypothetical protein